MTGDRLTRRTFDALKALNDLDSQLGKPPTVADVARRMGVSPSVARGHFGKLERMGLITREHGRHHGNRLTAEGRATLEAPSVPLTGRDRPVLRIDLETGERVRFESAAEAARATYCGRSTVAQHASGRFKHDFDGRWRFNWIMED